MGTRYFSTNDHGSSSRGLFTYVLLHKSMFFGHHLGDLTLVSTQDMLIGLYVNNQIVSWYFFQTGVIQEIAEANKIKTLIICEYTMKE